MVETCLPWVKDEEWFKNDDLRMKNDDWLEKLFNLEKDRITTLNELPDVLKFIFELPKYDEELLIWKKSDLETAKKVLSEVKEFLETVDGSDFEEKRLMDLLVPWIKEKGYGNGDVLYPMRVALSGQKNSPGPFEIAGVLGKEEVILRIDKVLK